MTHLESIASSAVMLSFPLNFSWGCLNFFPQPLHYSLAYRNLCLVKHIFGNNFLLSTCRYGQPSRLRLLLLFALLHLAGLQGFISPFIILRIF